MKFVLIYLILIISFSSYSQKNLETTGLKKSQFSNFSNKKNFIAKEFSPFYLNKLTGDNCYDNSFTKTISLTNRAVFVYNVLHTSEDGVFICGAMYDTTKYLPVSHFDGFILKMDSKGNILWAKQIQENKLYAFSSIGIYAMKELSNHEIIAVADIDTTKGFNNAAIILKLTQNGDLVWYKSLQTSLFPSSLNYGIYLSDITETSNGDLILCGSSTNFQFAGNDETIVRLSAMGNIIWSDDFTNINGFTNGANGVATYMINGNIIECGLSFGGTNNSYVTAINFLTLDYTTGNLLNKKFYVPNYTDVHKNQNKGLGRIGTVKCKLLNNGHYLVYGVIDKQRTTQADSTDYFGVVEFDESFNLVNSYLISALNKTGIDAGSIEVTAGGQVYYSLYNNLLQNGDNLFCVSDYGNQISKSRKIHYTLNRNAGSFSPIVLFNDNGYGFTRSFSLSANSDPNIFEFKKLHDVDTTSGCLGTDSLLTIHAPYNLRQDPNFQYLDNNTPNKVLAANFDISVSDFTNYDAENGCTQQNNCNSIRIHGTVNICGTDDAVYFTATRNKNCGAFAQWSMDTSAFSSLKQVNDTTVAIKFKSANWDGKLHAHLATASCNMYLPEDSIELHVKAETVVKLNLGVDTIFCANITPLLLHAGSQFKEYAWQNGSTDSTLAVTTTGKYFVAVIDQCNNIQSDTINVTEASDAFRINNDTAKCNNDTIILKAPLGFTNYSWQPNYNLITVAKNIVNVNPSTDTTYFAFANLASCSVHDEVHIKVFHSPSVNFGNDTSICYGTKVMLNAGDGFDKYLWNNGSQTKYIYADSVGMYSVQATVNSCSSYDTINITSLKPLPFVNLGNDTTFCYGNEFTLTPVVKNADKYYWQDGTAAPNIVIKHQGEYFLTAFNTCGSYTDSIKISQSACKLILPSAFTPNNDGLNDIFKVKYAFPVKNFKMIIYNRWGQQIFVSEDIAKGWDGNYKNIPANQSTYVWIIFATYINNVTTTLHGTVTLIR